jgi:hypothetical protein
MQRGNMMFGRIVLTVLLLATSTSVFADCVYGAKDKTSYVVLDTHTILLKGGYGSDIVIKTYCFIYRTSDITVLKDDFCSYEDSVLYIDEEVCDANQVTKIQ